MWGWFQVSLYVHIQFHVRGRRCHAQSSLHGQSNIQVYLGKTEVCDDDVTLPVKEQVLWLEVPGRI